MTDVQQGWIILRTSGARTLPLARSLAAAGFDVWTPRQIEKRRLRCAGKAPVEREREMPITPTFLFTRADRVPDLFRILALPMNPHPPFSIFRHAGRIPLIADREMASLRATEERAARRARQTKRKAYVLGTRVRTDEPAFVGLTGVVEAGDGKHALVSFGGGFRVKIATWLLRTDEVQAQAA